MFTSGPGVYEKTYLWYNSKAVSVGKLFEAVACRVGGLPGLNLLPDDKHDEVKIVGGTNEGAERVELSTLAKVVGVLLAGSVAADRFKVVIWP
ncbi:unnamed protein product [Angiostrongylus costaricensis]|uniref:Iso_dh domain-containing protein n=1 Tax=Angiostrongylus costaricensis TaxID=334426 RepID=A0A0R3PE86_ANGCS|nr:unnamed protein product [Angiostrongylus costaricensis]